MEVLFYQDMETIDLPINQSDFFVCAHFEPSGPGIRTIIILLSKLADTFNWSDGDNI